MPILAFCVWAFLVLSFFPLLKLGLRITDELLAPHFLISFLILVLVWSLSGPAAAAALSVMTALVAIYLALAAREPSLALHAFMVAGLFVFIVLYLYEVQKSNGAKEIAIEHITEEVNLIRREQHKKEELHAALEHKIHRFLDLQRFSRELKDMDGLQRASKKILAEAREILGKADSFALYLVNESRQELELAAGLRAGSEPLREKEGTLFDQWVMKRGRPLVVEDASNDFRFPVERRTAEDSLRSLCAAPLMAENKVLGVLRASALVPNAFSSDDLRMLDILASLAAVVLRNMILYERMKELATRDSLTGLYLSRVFQERLAEEVARANIGGGSFSLVMLDVDHFKRLNDELGHSAGDLVLRNVAAALRRGLAEGDLLARYGGEEFVALLPTRSKAAALTAAEKLRRGIERERFALRRTERRVTASFGVAAFPSDGRTKEELLRSVDKALYEAKALGRNRVCGAT